MSTGDPDYPPEASEAKNVKIVIGNKAELADCAKGYDMEAELEGIDSDMVESVPVGKTIDTNMSGSPRCA